MLSTFLFERFHLSHGSWVGGLDPLSDLGAEALSSRRSLVYPSDVVWTVRVGRCDSNIEADLSLGFPLLCSFESLSRSGLSYSRFLETVLRCPFVCVLFLTVDSNIYIDQTFVNTFF